MALRNRVAVVTGASRGIGKEIALALGRAGVRVAVTFHTNKSGAQKVLAELRALGTEGLALATDVTDPARVKELIDAVAKHFGRLDVLVNNVGDFEWKPVVDATIESWAAIIQSNLFSVFYTTKFALPIMRRQHWGRIINLGAVGAERAFGQAKISAYSAAKAAIVAFTRSVALEEARQRDYRQRGEPAGDRREGIILGRGAAPLRRAFSRRPARHRPRRQRGGKIFCLGRSLVHYRPGAQRQRRVDAVKDGTRDTGYGP